MNSFQTFITELKRGTFMDVAHTSVDDAREFFDNAIQQKGYYVDKDFPNFNDGYVIAKHKIAMGKYDRKMMPVVKAQDFEKFTEYMKDVHGTKTTKGKEKAINLIPIQKQLYMDNPATNIVKYGLKEAITFLRSKSHAIISRDNFVMDGNHRLLLALIYDYNMMLQVNRVDMNAEQLYHEMNHFTDNIIKRQRNEEIGQDHLVKVI